MNWAKVGWIAPVVLAILAGILNFLAIRSTITPIVLVKVSTVLKVGDELKESHMERASLRAEAIDVKSIVRWEDRGLILGRRVNRDLNPNEMLFFADVREVGSEIRQNLRSGEISVTLVVDPSRIVPGVRIGEDVDILLVREGPVMPVPEGEPAVATGPRVVGPFRVVGFGERQDPSVTSFRPEMRQVVVAVRARDGEIVDRAGQDLEKAVRKAGRERVEAITFARR